VTRGWLPQRAGSLGLNSGGTAAAVPPTVYREPTVYELELTLQHNLPTMTTNN